METCAKLCMVYARVVCVCVLVCVCVCVCVSVRVCVVETGAMLCV